MDSTAASTNNNGEVDSVKHGTSKEQKDCVVQESDPSKVSSSLLGDKTNEDEEMKDSFSFLRSFAYFDDKSTTDILDDSYGKLARDADIARKQGSFCDITLIVGPDKYQIEGHRLVLASAFDYFQAMFTSNLKEGSQPEVELPKTDAKTMESLIDFAYTGKMKLNNSNIETTTTAANFFGMSTLLGKCVDYIKGKINQTNCIEILEFAEHISDDVLKYAAMKYVSENFETITEKNLDIVEMSTNLLLEVIDCGSTIIHSNPVQNEMKLFQIGWNNLHSKPDDQWSVFLPKLLKAVRLPQASDDFLCNLARKVEFCKEAYTLVEEAKLKKKAITNYKATTIEPKIDENMRWGMCRFHKSGRVSVTCHGVKDDSNDNWYGAPVFINGMIFCVNAITETKTDDGPPVKYLEAYLYCLTDLSSDSVTLVFHFEVVPSKKSNNISGGSDECETTLDKDNDNWGEPKMMKLTDVFANFYDEENDSCTIIAHVSEVDVKEADDLDD